MNSSSILDSLKNATNLVDGSLIADPLKAILIGLCDIVNQQQIEISSLKNAFSEYIALETFQSTITGVNNDIANIKTFCSQQFANINSEIQKVKTQVIAPLQNTIQESQNQFESKAKELEQSIDSQVHFLVQQNTTHSKNQKAQIEKISTTLDSLLEDYEGTKKKVASHDLFDSETVNTHLKSFNNTIKTMQENVSKLQTRTFSFIEEVQTKNTTIYDENFKKIFNILEDMNQLLKAFNLSNNQEDIKDTKTLVQAVERNSRRLDGFDKVLSSIKLDYSNVTDVVNSYQTAIIAFKEKLYEVSLLSDQSKEIVLNSLTNLSGFIDFACSNFDEISDNFLAVLDFQLSSFESSSKGFDQIHHYLSLISRQSMPDFNFLADSIEKSYVFKKKLLKKKDENNFQFFAQNFKKELKKKGKIDYYQLGLNLPRSQNDELGIDDMEDMKEVAPLVRDLMIPGFNNINVSINTIKEITDFFFKGEPLRLQVADDHLLIESIQKALKEMKIYLDTSINQLQTNLNAKVNYEFVSKKFEKTNKTMKNILSTVENYQASVDERILESIKNYQELHDTAFSNNNSTYQSPQTMNPSPYRDRGGISELPYIDHRRTPMNYRQSRSQIATVKQKGPKHPSPTKHPNTQLMKNKAEHPKSKSPSFYNASPPLKNADFSIDTMPNIDESQHFVKSAEISPRDRFKTPISKNTNILASSSVKNSPR